MPWRTSERQEMPLVGGFGCLELVLYGIRIGSDAMEIYQMWKVNSLGLKDWSYLSRHECLEMPDVVGLGLAEALHQQLRDLRLPVKLRLAQPQLSLRLKTEIFQNYF